MNFFNYVIGFILILLIWALIVEPNLLFVKRLKVECEQLQNTRIVFATDLHIKPYEMPRLKKLVRTINRQKPDIVLLGGDYVNGHRKGRSMPVQDIARELGNINAPTIGIIGNHDGWQGKEEAVQALEKNGIKVLVNENIKVNNLYIAGLDDIQTGRADISKALANTSFPTVLLTHSPDTFLDLDDENILLVLAGHLHGGQIVFPFMKPFIVPSIYGNKYAYGLIKENDKTMFVSRGLGTSILAMRFNCPPEIVVIDFFKKQ